MKTNNFNLLESNKVFGVILVLTGLILLVPLVAMQFKADVNWSVEDFTVIGVLLLVMGSLFVLTARRVRKTSNKILVGVAFILLILYIWAELAVGLFTNLGS